MNQIWGDVLSDINKQTSKPKKTIYTDFTGELIQNTGRHRRTMGMKDALIAAGKVDQIDALYALKHRLHYQEYMDYVSDKK